MSPREPSSMTSLGGVRLIRERAVGAMAELSLQTRLNGLVHAARAVFAPARSRNNHQGTLHLSGGWLSSETIRPWTSTPRPRTSCASTTARSFDQRRPEDQRVLRAGGAARRAARSAHQRARGGARQVLRLRLGRTGAPRRRARARSRLRRGPGRYVLAQMVGPKGKVVGVDMTAEQLAVARKHQDWHTSKFGHCCSNVAFVEGYIEELDGLGLEPASFDVIVSNCVINLSPRQGRRSRGRALATQARRRDVFRRRVRGSSPPRCTQGRSGALGRMLGRRALLGRFPRPVAEGGLRRCPPRHRAHALGRRSRAGGKAWRGALLFRDVPPVQHRGPRVALRGLRAGGDLQGRHPRPRDTSARSVARR